MARRPGTPILPCTGLAGGDGGPASQLLRSGAAGMLRKPFRMNELWYAVKEALAEAISREHKGVIIDLRGNPGGLFMSAVSVAELFLSDGVIVRLIWPLALGASAGITSGSTFTFQPEGAEAESCRFAAGALP